MTEKLLIHGGRSLHGDVQIAGGKNTALAVISAAVLCDEADCLENLPDITDVRILLDLLRSIGVGVRKESQGTIIDPTTLNSTEPDPDLCRKMRASYYLLGALLGRCREGTVSQPGGCEIGTRAINLHIKGFNALGAQVDDRFGKLHAHAPQLYGTEIFMDRITVGGTINVMLAAAKAQGNTVIYNAAREPHVVDTANFINSMGGRVRGAGTDVIRIRGASRLHGCTYSVIPDQIETGTFMIAAAATHGDVTLHGCIPAHMESLSAKLLEMGARVDDRDDMIRVRSLGGHRAVNFKTQEYPGFPTDLQAPMSAVLTTATGTSMVTETIFDARFRYLDEMVRMGARAHVYDRMAIIEGVPSLFGAPIAASDLRAGAALVVAGLIASGCTEISNLQYIDRGYEHLEDKLRALGANIERVTENE